MKSTFRLIIFAIIGLPMVAFAIANRHLVDIGLDPFAGSPPENSLKLPLFLVAFAALVLGVFLGGIAAWFGQGKHRKAARLAKADLARLRAETADDAKPANDR